MNLNKGITASKALNNRLPVIVFWVFSLFLLFWGLYQMPLIGSAHRWAEVAREMRISGDVFHPTINGEPYLDKPLGGYWLILLTASITGSLNQWAVKLPSAVAGLLALWATGWLGRKLWSEQTGRTAGWILLTTYGFLMWGRRGEADIANLAAIILAVAWYWARRDKFNFGGYLVFYLICFIGAHAKGLTAIVLPIIVILPDIIRQRRWRSHLKLAHFAALVVGLAVYLMPFIFASMSNPDTQSGGLYLVFRENIQRFLNPFDHIQPFYVYLIHAPQLFLPWAPLLLIALAGLFRSIRTLEYKTRWLLEATALIFLFFSASGSRRFYYILPILPFCALATAVFFDSEGMDRWKRLGLNIQKALFGLTLFVMMLSPAMWSGIKKFTGFVFPRDIMIGTPLLGLAGLIIWLMDYYRSGRLAAVLGIRREMAPLVAAALILMGGFFTWQYVSLEKYDTKTTFAMDLKKLVTGVDRGDIVFYNRFPTKVIFYADLPVPLKVFHNAEEIRPFLESRGKPRIIISRREDSKEFLQFLPAALREEPSITETIHPWEDSKERELVAWKIEGQEL